MSSSNLIHHTGTSSLLLSLSLNNNGRFRSQYFSSESQSQQTKVESEESPNKISRTELRDVTKKDTANGASKIKLFVHKYGIVFVVTCTCVYLTTLGSFFFLIDSGLVDPSSLTFGTGGAEISDAPIVTAEEDDTMSWAAKKVLTFMENMTSPRNLYLNLSNRRG